MQIARIAFCQAVGKHDPARGRFAMFAGFVMQSALTSAISCERRRTCVSLDALTQDSEGGVSCLLDRLADLTYCVDPEAVEMRAALSAGLHALKGRDCDALLSWACGYTLLEIGNRQGRTGEAIRLRLCSVLRRLRATLLVYRLACLPPVVCHYPLYSTPHHITTSSVC
jgi:hypothetical protein